MRNMQELINAVNAVSLPTRWAELFDDAYAEHKSFGEMYVRQEYLEMLNNKYRVFKRTLDEVLEAVEKLHKKPEYILLSCLMNHAMKNRELIRNELLELEIPKEHSELFDTAMLFSVFPYIPETARMLKERGLPEDIYYDTLRGYENSIIAYKNRNDRVGYGKSDVDWLLLFIGAEVLYIGRLEFEIRKRFGDFAYIYKNKRDEYCVLVSGTRVHKDGMITVTPGYEDEDKKNSVEAEVRETEEYYEGYPVIDGIRVATAPTRLNKDEWQCVLMPGDPILSIHIAADGKLTPEACESAYERARVIFAKHYPEFKYKAFRCFSWLISPQLTELLPAESNIVRFQEKFIKYPGVCSGKAVLTFVFHNRFTDYDDLSENTSLERALKRYYKSGKRIYEVGGVFF